MTNEERDVITRFIERVSGGATAGGGSVPGSQNLPPVDRDADALIADLFTRHPEARYRITQLAYVQEQALAAAQQRLQALQQQVQQLQSQGGAGGGSSPWGQPAQPQSRGFLSSLFGGGSSQPPPPPPPQYQPPPQYAPQYAAPPAMMQQQGTGFLGGALRTAAGVAGGLVAGEALMSLFEGNRGGGFGGGGFGGGFGNETAMPGGFMPGADPGWVGGGDPGFAGVAGPAADFAPDPGDQGGALKSDTGWAQAAPDQAAPDQGGGWQQAASDTGGGGWQDAAPDQGGGWDNASDDGGGWTDSSGDA